MRARFLHLIRKFMKRPTNADALARYHAPVSQSVKGDEQRGSRPIRPLVNKHSPVVMRQAFHVFQNSLCLPRALNHNITLRKQRCSNANIRQGRRISGREPALPRATVDIFFFFIFLAEVIGLTGAQHRLGPGEPNFYTPTEFYVIQLHSYTVRGTSFFWNPPGVGVHETRSTEWTGGCCLRLLTLEQHTILPQPAPASVISPQLRNPTKSSCSTSLVHLWYSAR